MSNTKSDKSRDELGLEFCVAQLRHAYAQLMVGQPMCPPGYWDDEQRRRSFAKGLLGPVIVRLEARLNRGEPPVESKADPHA